MKKVAIVTCYFPKAEHVLNIRKISEQVDIVVVCDNSPHNSVQLF